MSQLTKGTKVDDYIIDALVGVGGMGAVYRARDGRSGETVALKFLLRDDLGDEEQRVAARRFRDEGAAALRIKSPHLAELKATGDSAEFGPYLVLEYLSGRTLRSILEAEGPFSAQEAFSQVAEPLLSALASLHEAGIVHRDVKPENLFAGADGRFKLGDLGLASFEGREAATKTGLIVGSPGYIAPERLMGTESATAAADCFSAAIVLCEALTGRHPQERLSAMDRVLRPITAADLRKLGLRKELRDFLALALANSVEKRVSSAKEMLAKLRELLLGDDNALVAGNATKVVESAFHAVPSGPKASATFVAGSFVRFFLLLLVFFLFGAFIIGHHFSKGPRGMVGGKVTRKFPSLPRSLEQPVEKLRKAADKLGTAEEGNLTEGPLLAYMVALDELAQAMKKRHIEAANVVKPWEYALASLTEESPLRLAADGESASLSGNLALGKKILEYAIIAQRRAVLAAPNLGNLFLLDLLLVRRLRIEDLSKDMSAYVDILFGAEQFIGELEPGLDEEAGVVGSQLRLHSYRFKLLALHGKPFMCLPLAQLCSLLLQNRKVPQSFRQLALFSLRKDRQVLLGRFDKTTPKFIELVNATASWADSGPAILSTTDYEKAWKFQLNEAKLAEDNMNGAANTLKEKMRTLLENMRGYKKFKSFAELPKAFKRLVWSSHRCCWVPYIPLIPKACRRSKFLRSYSCVLYSHADLLHGSEVYKMQLSPPLFQPALVAREAFERSLHGLLRLADKVSKSAKRAQGPQRDMGDVEIWFANEHLLLANGINWFRAAAIWYPQAQERWLTLEKRLPKESLARRLFKSTYAFGKQEADKALKLSKEALDYGRSLAKGGDETFYWYCISHICRERWAYMRLVDKSKEAAMEARELQELVEPFALSKVDNNEGKKRIWALSVVFQYLDALVRIDTKARLRLFPKLKLLKERGNEFKYASKAGFLLREEVLGPRQL